MRKAFLSSLLFAFLTSASVAVTAAPAMPAEKNNPMAPAAMQEQMTPRVNINTAEAETLQKQLSGIGKGKAEAIVAYREANGEFTSVDELIEVKGIGKALLDKNRDRLVVE
ncbi:ComEA family DNA-binding protein [Pseudomonas quasicaspiana]|uniref:ComEA family DNA-binding protein n=1 Tax=Pseudomonas quasicaspiana TaxID=2829821 RepID=UPI001E5AAF35|nr:helix-hairpin-helix domain-containing protein [Pseudomonas quasicaspiana]MCD5978843.1 helix-hairpin-helix domain-containing protein [Pseudomonas quasicaspiana]